MITAMDADLIDLARTVDLTVLGARVKTARLAKRLTQTEVAGAEMSTAYVSRIESGQRRPDPDLLEVIASRVDVSVDQLVLGTSRDTITEARLALVSAEVEMRTGDAHAALRRVDETLMDLAGHGQHALQRETLRLKAAALEATGRLDEAIIMLEDLTESAEPDTLWVVDMTRLCRCYRVSGDFVRSVDVGERAYAEVRKSGLDSCDEAVTLMLSLSASYNEHGQVGTAIRLCHRAIELAEALGSPASRGIAYWSASIMESRRGRSEAALSLARKAIAYIDIGEDFARRATVRSQLGILQLRAEVPTPGEALANLRQAAFELAATDAAPVTVASNHVAQARALLMLGRHHEAEDILDYAIGTAETPRVTADALVLRGQIAMSRNDTTSARQAYQSAVNCLTGLGADATSAQLWFELGSLFESIGDTQAARDAYRSAGASAGLVGINSAVGLEAHTELQAIIAR